MMKTISGYVFRYQKSGMLSDVVAEYKGGPNAKDFAKLLRDIYAATECDIEAKEFCFCLLLNRQLKPVGYVKVSEGGLTATLIDVRLIIKAALDLNADAIVLAHNHPSGNTKPSRADVEQTKKVKKGCEVFNISFVDHLILTPEETFSFSEEDVI